jgi:hypothetical protein
MSVIELAALIAGFLMAVARLARVAAPLWSYGPSWVQPLLATLPLMATELAGKFGAVHTKLDLAEVLLVAGLVVAASVRGVVSKGAAVAVLLIVACFGATACGAFDSQEPAATARDAYETSLVACQLYELAPPARHTAEMDKICKALHGVCGGAP